MRNRQAMQWAGVLAALIVAGGVVTALLSAQGARTTSQIVLAVTQAAVLGWLVWGAWRWRHLPAVRRLSWIGAATLGVVLLLIPVAASGRLHWAIAVAGAWTMALSFFFGLWLIRTVLAPGHPVMGVARTLVDEAIRMKIAMVFIVMLVLVIPMLPATQNPGELLHYRVQQFLSWSLSGAELLLGLMTVFLACGTICNEVYQRQIFLTMTKPISRGQYLLGKWLGIGLLNLLLLGITGGSVYVFAKMLENEPLPPGYTAADVEAHARVRHEVLVARATVQPRPPEGMNLDALVNRRLEQLKLEHPGVHDQGFSDATVREARNWVIAQQWHTLAPPTGGTGFAAQRFLFTGLEKVRNTDTVMQLRLKPKASKTPDDGKVRLGLMLNGTPYPVVDGSPRITELPDDTVAVIVLPTAAIDPAGRLEVTIANLHQFDPVSISFNPKDGLQLLYRTGSFEQNLLRAMAVSWIKLAFLAMVGLAAGTFLGFPVASLASVLVFLIAISSGYLTESLKYFVAFAHKDQPLFNQVTDGLGAFFSNLGEGKIWEAMKMPIWLIGHTARLMVPSFAGYDVATPISEGRQITLGTVAQAWLRIGLLSTGVAALVGWAIFRKRELATATN